MNVWLRLIGFMVLREASALSLDKAASHQLPHLRKAPDSAVDGEKPEDAPVVKVENEIRRVGKEAPKKLMDAIDMFRAKICANMKDEHGRRFGTFEECHEFMKKACKPGKDKEIDRKSNV